MSNGVTDYKTAGFGNKLGIGKSPALLVVDMVQAYFDPESPLYANVERERDVAVRLVEASRKARIPVVWTGVRYQPGGIDGGLFYKKVKPLRSFDEGNPLGRFADGLEPEKDEVVVIKQYASAFFGTSLSASLTALGIDSLFIIGLTTSGCVRATALDALQNGYIPILVKDACGDRSDDIQAANLFDLEQKYADVITEDEALSLMSELDQAR